MIVKFDGLSGETLCRLLAFIHGGENVINERVPVAREVVKVMDIKAAFPVYAVALEVREKLVDSVVDPKFLLRIYQIVHPESVSTMEDVVEDYLRFVWRTDLGFWYCSEGHVEVLVFPPDYVRSEWNIVIPSRNRVQAISGENAEKRAFSVAALYAQKKQ